MRTAGNRNITGFARLRIRNRQYAESIRKARRDGRSQSHEEAIFPSRLTGVP